jgi:type I restriction enzyme M protein
LEAVSSELKALDQEIEETDKSIADFCKELNISTPF